MKRASYVIAALLASFVGCTFPEPQLLDEGRGTVDTAPTPEGEIVDGCSATRCVDVELQKAVSFVAVRAGACPSGDVQVSVFRVEGGERIQLDTEEKTVGQGHDCDGALAPGDIKIEGIDARHVEVCVTFTGAASAGDVVVFAKSGGSCVSSPAVAGSCEPCAPACEGAACYEDDPHGGCGDHDCDDHDD